MVDDRAMDLRFSEEDEAFRKEVAGWLADNLSGEFAAVRGRGGPGDENAMFDERAAWERKLGKAGWTCVGWPKEYGCRELSFTQQIIFYEEYARAAAPGRLGHIGETLLGPTVIAFGSEQQKKRFLPPIVTGEELWTVTLENNANANPMTYLGRSGRQRVAVVAGDTVVVFALP